MPDEQAASRWVRVEGTEIENLDGRWWHDWPAPPREHAHTAASRGYASLLDYTERCACGAVRLNGRIWFHATRDEQPERVAAEPTPPAAPTAGSSLHRRLIERLRNAR